jgi:hypothetical protein
LATWSLLEETEFGQGCSIDQKSLATALRFVANQSTKLNIKPAGELHRRISDLFEARNKILKELSPSGRFEDDVKAMANDRYVAADKAADELMSSPDLLFHINRLALGAGLCVGIVKATLSVDLDDAKMAHTHTRQWSIQNFQSGQRHGTS